MEERFLIDTNVVIYYLKGEIPETHVDKITELFRESFNISTVTKIEVLGWHKIDNNEKSRIKKFLKNANVIYIDQSIENKAIHIKQNHKIEVPDAIIGATAVVYNFTLVTTNKKDFEQISELKIYNPFE